MVHRNLADTADKFVASRCNLDQCDIAEQETKLSRAVLRRLFFSLRPARAVVDRAGHVLRQQACGVATITKRHEKRRGNEGDRFHYAASHSYQL